MSSILPPQTSGQVTQTGHFSAGLIKPTSDTSKLLSTTGRSSFSPTRSFFSPTTSPRRSSERGRNLKSRTQLEAQMRHWQFALFIQTFRSLRKALPGGPIVPFPCLQSEDWEESRKDEEAFETRFLLLFFEIGEPCFLAQTAERGEPGRRVMSHGMAPRDQIGTALKCSSISVLEVGASSSHRAPQQRTDALPVPVE